MNQIPLIQLFESAWFLQVYGHSPDTFTALAYIERGQSSNVSELFAIIEINS